MPNSEERVMCRKLKEIDNLTPDEILLISGIDSYPVDMQKVLKKLGIHSGPMDFSTIESEVPDVIKTRGCILGAVIVIDDDVKIFYRQGSSHNRERFTLAHELAHCCLNASSLQKGHIEFRFDGNAPDQKELAANIFAGQLLIPERPLKKLYESLVVPASDVLAREFEVSTHVMEARLEYLGLGFYSPRNYDGFNGES